VPKEEMPKLLAAIPAWNLVDEDSAISRKFVARNFKAGGCMLHPVQPAPVAWWQAPDLQFAAISCSH